MEEEKSEEKEECKEKLEEIAQKNLGDSQKDIIGGTNKNLEKINTSRLVQEDYILHTHSPERHTHTHTHTHTHWLG